LKMSSAANVESDVCCANCGVAEVDDIKLEECDGCDRVKYCGDKCREDHREQHKEECNKRRTELHDRKLFRQPERSHLGECPLCFLPMPLDPHKYTFWPCCCKSSCNGCTYTNNKINGSRKCPFCREPIAGDEENKKRVRKRIKAGDPAAMSNMGTKLYHEGDCDKAFEYWTKAAELGDVGAHYQLSVMYGKGCSVEKDEEKAVYHAEKAAIGGDPNARHELGRIEHENGNIERAVKHLIIASNLGHEISMKALWEYFKRGNITKDELENTLRTHKAALDEMKSPEREAAEAWRERQ
jgi:hypothetical protein